ncbi:MAG: hypothetical protein ACYDAY_00110 [Candidatus Dormibacteria bacterium]
MALLFASTPQLVPGLLAGLAGVVMSGFAASVYTRYVARRGPHLLAWTIGLTFFAIASLAEGYIGVTDTQNRVTLGLWYVSGAVLTGAWIGQGSILLLAPSGARRATTIVLAVLSVAAVVAFIGSPLDFRQVNPTQPVDQWYRAVMASGAPSRALLTALTIILNIYGTVGAVGGALWSAILFQRRRVFPERVRGNTLIAAGVIVIASAGTLTHYGLSTLLPVSELIAAALMFWGFRVSSGASATAAPN